ncbi:hypothetical protein SPRG_05804 [Saprolegnia parasitica CBS 223.65]|uniref:Phosphorylated adapter RNA export protein n=1 Tax=Saprolegnia parasitica (strain CBS 223.65) TaxID=695850 RepID=A0A067CQW5_SAPPC|nr:hypothetical protein SPRG_05804 [Saprolegnia parasitica CBS 223.65]KDO28931.1 hypothetical protein SPRG_05804 [Saprolegnia parasitica CBS 223.65]|eukprot:XP_012200472.1 hypothetical protein SPRG_05804 [Saprolegnia parasitica CBS 223.65]
MAGAEVVAMLTHAQRVGREIARVLGERKIHLVVRTVELIGERLTRSVLSETLLMDKEGKTLKTTTGRERTLGGAFFTLLKERVTKEKYKEIYALEEEAKKKARKNKERAARIKRENELIGGLTSQMILKDDDDAKADEADDAGPSNPRFHSPPDRDDDEFNDADYEMDDM